METPNYKLGVALLQLKVAWSELVKLSKELDPNLSELYPFFLLDYETLEPAVVQWCTLHASRLLRDLPDRVPNPACWYCGYFNTGIGPDGVCKGFKMKVCMTYPFVPFTRAAIVPALMALGYDVANMSDADVHITYLRKVDEKCGQSKTDAT